MNSMIKEMLAVHREYEDKINGKLTKYFMSLGIKYLVIIGAHRCYSKGVLYTHPTEYFLNEDDFHCYVDLEVEEENPNVDLSEICGVLDVMFGYQYKLTFYKERVDIDEYHVEYD